MGLEVFPYILTPETRVFSLKIRTPAEVFLTVKLSYPPARTRNPATLPSHRDSHAQETATYPLVRFIVRETRRTDATQRRGSHGCWCSRLSSLRLAPTESKRAQRPSLIATSRFLLRHLPPCRCRCPSACCTGAARRSPGSA